MSERNYKILGYILLILTFSTFIYMCYFMYTYDEINYIPLDNNMVEIPITDTIRNDIGFIVNVNTPSYLKDTQSNQIYKYGEQPGVLYSTRGGILLCLSMILALLSAITLCKGYESEMLAGGCRAVE